MKHWQCQLRVSVESQCRFEICSAKCFLEVNNGVSGNNIRQVVPVAYDSIVELTGLKFKTVTSGGNTRGRGFHMY